MLTALLAFVCLLRSIATGADLTAGSLASRHQDAVMHARYLEYSADLERQCGEKTAAERISVAGQVNIDGWSLIASHIEIADGAQSSMDIQYFLRNGIAVRQLEITHPEYPPAARTPSLPVPVSQSVFQREAPMHPMYLFTAFMGRTLALESKGEDAARSCAKYRAVFDFPAARGALDFCVDSATGLVKHIDTDMTLEDGCRYKARAEMQTLAGPPSIMPPDEVAAVFEKESGAAKPDTKKPASARSACELPRAPARIETYTARHGLPDAPVTRLFIDRNGTVWAASRKGVARFGNASWTLDTAGGKLFGLSIADLLVRPDGSLWIATTAGILTLENGTWSAITTVQGLPDNNVTSLIESTNGRVVWAGTMRGLGRWDKGAWRTLTTEDGLPGNDITALAIDRYGTLWVGTPNGLAIYSGGRFSRPDPALPISGQFIKNLTAMPDGSVWAIAGALPGIVEMRTDSWVHHTGRTGLPCAHVAHAAPGPDGCLWAACLDIQESGHEILTYDGISWRSMPMPGGAFPYFLAPAQDGSLWAAARDGVMRLFFE